MSVDLKVYAARYEQKYASLLAAAARGKEIDPEELIEVAGKLGKGWGEAQADVERETKLFEEIATREAICDPKKFEAAMAAYVDAMDEVESLKKELGDVNQRLAEAVKRRDAAREAKDGLHAERTEATKELRRLRGEPIPRRSAGTGPINVGGMYQDA